MKRVGIQARLVRYGRLAALGSLVATVFLCDVRGQGSIGIIPLFHDRTDRVEGDDIVQLTHQRVIVFVYRNAAAVYMDAGFVNTESDSIKHEIALPSSGHTSIRSSARSNGILGVRLWVGGERVEPATEEGKVKWYTITPAFGSHEEKSIRALFWIETAMSNADAVAGQDSSPIAEGNRALLVDLEHASAWKDVIQSVDVSVTLRESLTRRNAQVRVEPKNYVDQNAGYLWSMQDVEPSFNDDISILYTPPGMMTSHWNTRAKLSDYMTTTVYDELLRYVRQLDEE